MYLAQVSRPSAPGGAPVSMAGLEEYLPEQLKSMLPSSAGGQFAVLAAGMILLAIAFSGGVGGGTYRGKR